MTPAPNNLWALRGQLFELLEAREDFLAARSATQRIVAIAEADTEELHDAERQLLIVNGAIGDFVNQKVSEVTEIRACYLALIDGAGVAKAEAQRATNRQLLLENRAARLKELIKLCMETLGAKRFDSAMGQFLIKGNGGKAPVVVTDESLVPDEFCEVTVTMGASRWHQITECIEETVKESEIVGRYSNPARVEEIGRSLDFIIAAKVVRTPRKSLIAEALLKPCSKCNGVGAPWNNSASVPCPECGGSGKASVPGARLDERGDHLEIK